MSKRQTNRGFKSYAPRTYWKNGNMFEEEIHDSLRFQPESTFSFVLVESVKDIVFISMLKFKHGLQG